MKLRLPQKVQRRLFKVATSRLATRTPRKSRLSSTEAAARSHAREKRAEARMSPKAAARRVLIAGCVFAVCAICVVVRAYNLQIRDTARYQDAAERQAVTSARIHAKRGVIKDRHGAELAISVDVDTVYAEPRRMADPRDAAKKLAAALGQKPAQVEKKLTSGKPFVYLKRKADPQAAKRALALGITGVGVEPEPKRFYSNRDLAAHVLGFTSFEGDGRAGMELAMDETLRGRSYEIPGLRDALGNRVYSEGFVPQAVLEGDDVLLTLDRQIQHAAETELQRVVTENGGVGGVAMVVKPETGDILALASWPSFNPNNMKGAGPNQQLNRAVSAVYEPGSTMKLVTIAAALEEHVIRPETQVDCEGGAWRVGGRTINDSDHKYGILTVAGVLKVSSNICAAKIGMKLGREPLHKWLTAFGFGEKTGVELPGELRGLLRPANSWRDIALANISFGQGISATPLQVVQAAGIVANKGMKVPPRIVLATQDKAGVRTAAERPQPARVLTEETAAALARMMIEVTEEGGTAEKARIPGFNVAGKTGTSQKIDPVTKAYSRQLYVASFVGFVPAEKPEVLVYVMVDEPKRSIYGGQVAAPAFARIATAALSALEVYPEDPLAREAFLAAHQKAQVEAMELAPVAIPAPEPDEPDDDLAERDRGPESGFPLDVVLSAQARTLLGLKDEKRDEPKGPPPPDHLIDPSEVEAPSRLPKDPQRMPNFVGLALSEVLNRSAEIGCDLVLSGTGRVVKQAPRAGAVVRPGTRCEFELAWERAGGSKT